MWFLDSIGYPLYEQVKDSLGKNLRWYLLVRVWFVIALVAHVHYMFECSICLSQVLSSE